MGELVSGTSRVSGTARDGNKHHRHNKEEPSRRGSKCRPPKQARGTIQEQEVPWSDRRQEECDLIDDHSIARGHTLINRLLT